MRLPRISPGKRIAGGHRLEPQDGAELARRGRQEIAIPAHDLARMRRVPEDRAGIDLVHWMGAKHEAGHHAEIPAAAAQRPEQILMAVPAWP